MAPTGPGEGGRQAQGVLRMRVGDGRRGSGVQNAGALPCPRAFRPSGRVRSDLSSPVTASPPGSRGCVRRLGEARRPVSASAWYWICGVAPLGAFVRAGSSERLVFDSGPGNGVLHSVPGTVVAPFGAFVRAGFSERLAFDSGPGNGVLHSVPGTAVAPLGAFVRGELLGAPGVSTRCRERGRFTCRVCGRSTRCVREGGLLGTPGVRLGGRERGAFHSAPDLSSLTRGAFMRASFSERLVVQLSVEDTGAFTRCGSAWALRSVRP